jgi:hypothetical protein
MKIFFRNFKISEEFISELLIGHLGGSNASDFLLLHFFECFYYFFTNSFVSLLLNFISLYESVLESQSSNESV